MRLNEAHVNSKSHTVLWPVSRSTLVINPFSLSSHEQNLNVLPCILLKVRACRAQGPGAGLTLMRTSHSSDGGGPGEKALQHPNT